MPFQVPLQIGRGDPGSIAPLAGGTRIGHVPIASEQRPHQVEGPLGRKRVARDPALHAQHSAGCGMEGSVWPRITATRAIIKGWGPTCYCQRAQQERIQNQA